MKNLFLICILLISLVGFSQTAKPFTYLPDFVYGVKFSRLAGDDSKMLILKPNGMVDTLTIPTGGGSSIYNGDSPATVSLGGYDAGDNITGTYDDILEKLLTPYQLPTFTSFSIPSQTMILEVGTTLSGTKNFSWIFGNSSNVAPNTMDVYDVTGASYIATNIGITSPANVAIGSITKTTASSHSWRGEATNTNSVVFTSSNFTVSWQWRRYWGFDSNGTLTNAELIAGSKELATTYTKSYTTSTPSGDQYLYFAYPASFGTISQIYVNGFPSIAAFTLSVQSHTNSQGVVTNYNIYKSNNTFNSSATIIIQ